MKNDGNAREKEANVPSPSAALSCWRDVQSIPWLTRLSIEVAAATMGEREREGCGRSAVALLITRTRVLFSTTRKTTQTP